MGGPNGDETFNVFDSTANSQAIIDYISVDTETHREAELTVFDFVTTGDLWEMGGGTVGFAAGASGYVEERFRTPRREIETVK